MKEIEKGIVTGYDEVEVILAKEMAFALSGKDSRKLSSSEWKAAAKNILTQLHHRSGITINLPAAKL